MNKNFVESFVEECYHAGLTELQTMVALEKSASGSTGMGMYDYGANSAEQEAAIKFILSKLYTGELLYDPDRDIFTDPTGLIADFFEENAGAFANAILSDGVYQGKKYFTNPLSSTKYLINFPRNMEARRMRTRNRVYDMLRVSDDGTYHGESADRIHAKLDIGEIYDNYEKAWQAHQSYEQEIAKNIALYDDMIAKATSPEQKASYEASRQKWLDNRTRNDAKLAEAKKAAEVKMAVLTKQHNRSSSSPEDGGMSPVMRATAARLSTLEQKRDALSHKYQIAKGGFFEKLFNPGTTLDAWTTGTAKMEADLTNLDEQIYALRQSLNEQREYASDAASDYSLEDMQGVHNAVHEGHTSANPNVDYSFLSPESRTQQANSVAGRIQRIATAIRNYFTGGKFTPGQPTAGGATPTTGGATPTTGGTTVADAANDKKLNPNSGGKPIPVQPTAEATSTSAQPTEKNTIPTTGGATPTVADAANDKKLNPNSSGKPIPEEEDEPNQ